MSESTEERIRQLTPENHVNLCHLLEISKLSTVDEALHRIKWLYHSEKRAEIERFTRNSLARLLSKIFNKLESGGVEREELREPPSYEDLLYGACKHAKVFERDTPNQDLEVYLSHAIIISALQKMKPRERVEIFEKELDFSNSHGKANIKRAGYTGPLTTFAVLGAAQASGFGVYMASTTALGFLTHAAGITLPFAAYTGLTSTIAFIIGPVGWLTAGGWIFWNLTQPKWKILIPVILLLIADESSRRIKAPSVNSEATEVC